MANRFWVGGAASWDGTAGTKWALTTGGAGGQAIPTAADDVFFDGASGANVVTIATGNTGAKSITCTGFTGTLAGSANISLAGSLLLVIGMSFTYSGTITFTATASITSAGKTMPAITINGSAITVTAQDVLIAGTLKALTLTLGKFDANGHNITFGSFSSSNSFTRTLDITGITFTLSSIGTVWNTSTSLGMTFTKTGSTIKIDTAAGSNTRTFTGGLLAFNNIWWSGSNSGTITMTSTNTYTDFKDDISVAHTLIFTAGTTTTVTTFTVSGTATAIITMQSSIGASAWNLSCASGIITCNWLSLQDSHAAGGATFNATNSTDVSGNTGWTITPPPASTPEMNRLQFLTTGKSFDQLLQPS